MQQPLLAVFGQNTHSLASFRLNQSEKRACYIFFKSSALHAVIDSSITAK